MKPFTSKYCTQYLTKSSPFNQEDDKKKIEEINKKISETEKEAWIRSNSTSEGYYPSPEEKRAQRKLARLEKRKKRKEQK